jgi:hypothetical protein
MKKKTHMFFMLILIEMIDAIGVKHRRPAFNTVNDIPLV